MIFPGPVKRDTSLFEHKYVGQICVACKQLEKIDNSLVASNIKSVDIVASGVGVKQLLSQIPYNQNEAISSRNSAQDRMFLTSTVYNDPLPGRGFEFGFANYYFPSPILPESEKNEPIRLELTFKDGSNQMLYKPMIIDLVDKTNFEKIILNMNQILVIELDGSEVNILELTDSLDWNPNIDQGETEF